MIRTVTTVFGAGATALLMTSPAQAELSFCNDTGVNASIAIGYANNDEWTSEGWWNVAPDDCITVVNDPRPQSYYYWHAVNTHGEFVSEDYYFCAVSDVFTIIGDTDCEARGHDRASFSEIQIPASGVSQVRLTKDLAPEPPAPRKAQEETPTEAVTSRKSQEVAALEAPQPAPEAPAAPEPAPEPEPAAAPEPTVTPKPTLTLAKNIPTSELLTTRPLDFPAIKKAVIGSWTEENEGRLTSEIEADTFRSFQDGELIAEGTWRVAATCPEDPGPGPAIISVLSIAPTDENCMVLDALSDDGFHVSHPTTTEAYGFKR